MFDWLVNKIGKISRKAGYHEDIGNVDVHYNIDEFGNITFTVAIDSVVAKEGIISGKELEKTFKDYNLKRMLEKLEDSDTNFVGNIPSFASNVYSSSIIFPKMPKIIKQGVI